MDAKGLSRIFHFLILVTSMSCSGSGVETGIVTERKDSIQISAPQAEPEPDTDTVQLQQEIVKKKQKPLKELGLDSFIKGINPVIQYEYKAVEHIGGLGQSAGLDIKVNEFPDYNFGLMFFDRDRFWKFNKEELNTDDFVCDYPDQYFDTAEYKFQLEVFRDHKSRQEYRAVKIGDSFFVFADYRDGNGVAAFFARFNTDGSRRTVFGFGHEDTYLPEKQLIRVAKKVLKDIKFSF